MRILQVSDFYPPSRGGMEAHVERLSTHLRRRDHDVVVLAGGASADGSSDGVLVHREKLSLERLPFSYQDDSQPFHPPWADGRFTRALGSLVRTFRPDVIHAHGWCSFSAARIARSLGVPLVVTLHDYGLLCPKKTLLRHGATCRTGSGLVCVSCDSDSQGLAKRVLLGASLMLRSRRLLITVSRFIAVSGYVRQRHIQAGIGEQQIVTIPNFIDLPADMSSQRDLQERYFLYVGASSSYKGMAILLDAYKRLKGAGREHKLVLVGGIERNTDDGSGVTQLGWVDGQRLVDLYCGALCVILPSVWPEPCPTVALEAMAARQPVIASAIGGLTDIVAQGRSGLLVPPGNPEALAEAMDALAGDPTCLEEMRDFAAKRVKEFSSTSIVPQIERIYREVIVHGR